MKNILFVFDRPIDPITGGVQRVTRSIADCLDLTKKWRTFFLSKDKSEKQLNEIRQFYLPEKHFHSRQNRKFFTEFCIKNKIHVVVHQSAVARTFPYVSECQKLEIPIVSVFHQPPDLWKIQKIKSIWSNVPVFCAIRRFIKGLHVKLRQHALYRDSSAVIFLTSEHLEIFKKNLSGNFHSDSMGKLYVIPNMAKLEFFPLPRIDFSQKKRELLFVGRLINAQKQVDLLLKIWAKLENKFPQWNLKIVGGGSDEAKIKALAGTLGLKRVSFEGFQNPENYYRDAAIFCMTSAYEGFPMVLNEAAAFGCVPVAFDSFAAVRDIITDGENGMLVSAFDLDAYAGTLAQLMSDNALRECLARNAQRDVERFSPEKILKKWEEIL